MKLIELSPTLRKLVKSGDKEVTIRKGKRVYPLGPAVFVISDEEAEELPILITSVDHVLMCQLSHFDALKDGFESADELRRGLLHFYPDLTPSSEMTVVYFKYTPSNLTV